MGDIYWLIREHLHFINKKDCPLGEQLCKICLNIKMYVFLPPEMLPGYKTISNN